MDYTKLSKDHSDVKDHSGCVHHEKQFCNCVEKFLNIIGIYYTIRSIEELRTNHIKEFYSCKVAFFAKHSQ